MYVPARRRSRDTRLNRKNVLKPDGPMLFLTGRPVRAASELVALSRILRTSRARADEGLRFGVAEAALLERACS
jgi:hypothetical protein